MLIHRIVRAPEKRIFYINVGNIAPAEIENFMQKTISKMKRTPHIDENTGEYNLRYNLQNLLEDYYIPVRGGDTNTKIDNLQGLQYDGIKDVEYLRDKVFAALKVPKAFMGYEKDLEGKSTLAAQDVRFARTIERIQSIILSELNKIALIHLYTQGYTQDDLVNFELSMTTPSIIYAQEKIALMKEKVDLAVTIIQNKLLPSDYIYSDIFDFSEDQYDEFRSLIIQDAKRAFRITQIESEGNDPLESGTSYGTPHDLATLYGRQRSEKIGNPPEGYSTDLDPKLGRPFEKATNRNTQDDNFGKDRLGSNALKDLDIPRNPFKTNYKGNSPLALENKTLSKHQENLLAPLKNKFEKKLIYEIEKKKESLLDEKQIKP
jgi:hypothetical protein